MQAAEVQRLTDKDIAQLRTLDGVESINPRLSVSTQYATRGGGYPKRITPLSIKADRTELKLAAGSLQEYMPQKGEVSIPESFLSSLGFKDASSAIGRPLFISIPKSTPDADTEGQFRTFEFTVAAVDKPTDTTVYYEASIRISTEDSQQMYEYQNGTEAGKEYYGVAILAREGTDMTALQRHIIEKGYQVYSLEDMRESLLQMVNITQWGLAGFGALAILASIFGIINTQYISVLERTQQIGLMKALGTRSRDISRLFRYKAAWIGLLGGILGVTLAWLVTLANPLAANWLELEEGTQLLQVDWIANVILVTALMCVAVASGYFPARKAARLDPIEALRTE